MRPTLNLGPIPFHIGSRDTPHNDPFPDEFPFAAQFDEKLGVISQIPDSEVVTMLVRAYAAGSQLGTPMNSYGLGKATCEDFLGFMQSALRNPAWSCMRVLEIGCGTGYLLASLKALGADVLGIEPGTNSAIHAEHAGIRVLHQPFETTSLDGQFDLIVHYGVLEHVAEPLDFLQRQLSLLSTSGQIVFAVPDCGAPVAHGDISMFVHEHCSYVT